jgi:hypothetical protein
MVSSFRAILELPTNEDIQRSFIGRGYQQVASYAQIDSPNTRGKCCMYSLPYEFEYFYDLDNYFQGGMFHKVRYLTMDDDFTAFEHKLFQLISQDFPFIECLNISNGDPQKDKQHSSILITFLNLERAHVDYAELFLLKKKLNVFFRWIRTNYFFQ